MGFKEHRVYYFSLFLILVVGLALSLSLGFDKRIQMVMVIITSLCYVLWGVIHHFLHHNLTLKIVVEYVLIGALGMSFIFFFLRGGVLY